MRGGKRKKVKQKKRTCSAYELPEDKSGSQQQQQQQQHRTPPLTSMPTPKEVGEFLSKATAKKNNTDNADDDNTRDFMAPGKVVFRPLKKYYHVNKKWIEDVTAEKKWCRRADIEKRLWWIEDKTRVSRGYIEPCVAHWLVYDSSAKPEYSFFKLPLAYAKIIKWSYGDKLARLKKERVYDHTNVRVPTVEIPIDDIKHKVKAFDPRILPAHKPKKTDGGGGGDEEGNEELDAEMWSDVSSPQKIQPPPKKRQRQAKKSSSSSSSSSSSAASKKKQEPFPIHFEVRRRHDDDNDDDPTSESEVCEFNASNSILAELGGEISSKEDFYEYHTKTLLGFPAIDIATQERILDVQFNNEEEDDDVSSSEDANGGGGAGGSGSTWEKRCIEELDRHIRTLSIYREPVYGTTPPILTPPTPPTSAPTPTPTPPTPAKKRTKPQALPVSTPVLTPVNIPPPVTIKRKYTNSTNFDMCYVFVNDERGIQLGEFRIKRSHGDKLLDRLGEYEQRTDEELEKENKDIEEKKNKNKNKTMSRKKQTPK